MPIEFHCEHCNKLIKAPDDAGGRTGKCPHCGSPTYIPRPIVGEEELDLAPLDPDDEQKTKRAIMEDAAVQRKLLHERSIPGEPAGRGGGKSNPTAPVPVSARTLSTLIVSFVEAMSSGKLDKAEEVANELIKTRQQAQRILDEMSGEDLGAYGMPALPRPVLLGFLKQLRAKL
jgi:hypothetical protein